MSAYEEPVMELIGDKVAEHRVAFVLRSVFRRWCPPRPHLKPCAGIATESEGQAEADPKRENRDTQ